MPNSLRLAEVAVAFGGRPVFRDVRLTVCPGECVVILGPSGCGKTSLLRSIAGDLAFSGVISAGDTPVEAGTYTDQVVLVPQAPSLWDHLTVLDNVSLIRRKVHAEQHGQADDQARDLLSLLEVEDVAERFPCSLSAGEQQRVALARGLAADRPILLLDEVTSNVDVERRAIVRKVIADMLTLRKIVVFVTHDLLTVRTMRYPVKELGVLGLRDVAHEELDANDE